MYVPFPLTSGPGSRRGRQLVRLVQLAFIDMQIARQRAAELAAAKGRTAAGWHTVTDDYGNLLVILHTTA